MKLITRDSDYAIRALCYIAQSGKETVSVSELVDHLKIPKPFLRKLMQTLNKKGIVQSTKGAGGGFALVRNPRKISLAQIIGVLQGGFTLNECRFKKAPCPNVRECVLRAKISAIEKRVYRELNAIDLGSLCGQ